MQWKQEDELGSWFVLDKFRHFLDKKLGNFGGKCLFFFHNADFFIKKLEKISYILQNWKENATWMLVHFFFICNFVMYPKKI
jgi:hypothetical protein